jgi:hypothetical protein|tara:strand:+ start:2687 stop:2842 length:156 start_codon:yes stop_codon:yes gene_type:complete
MPIPKVKKYETNKDYIQRCMGNAVMNQDYPTKDERYAVCQLAFKKNFDPKQ